MEPVPFDRVWLQRYSSDDSKKCTAPDNYGTHNAMLLLFDEYPSADSENKTAEELIGGAPPHDDLRWPDACACGYKFTDDDAWQVFGWQLFAGAPDGKLYAIREFPVGAMYDADWMRAPDGAHGEMYTGTDGISLCVLTPGGTWMVDSQASNCTRDQYGPGVDESGRHWGKMWKGRTHYCWCRHGDPRTGVITVDKNPEPGTQTCAAGAGSIQAGSYHGHLQGGVLT